MSNRAIAIKVADEYSTKWRNCYRWMYEQSQAKKDEVCKKAEKHVVGVTLPLQLKAMSIGRVRRSDIAETIDAQFVKRKMLCQRVDFNQFRSRFNYWYNKNNEKPPTESTISRFLKRANITLQKVSDHKSITVEERIGDVRDWFLRLDALQRKRSVDGMNRISDEDTYCCDEFSIVINPKTSTYYNRRGAEANQVKEVKNLC